MADWHFFLSGAYENLSPAIQMCQREASCKVISGIRWGSHQIQASLNTLDLTEHKMFLETFTEEYLLKSQRNEMLTDSKIYLSTLLLITTS